MKFSTLTLLLLLVFSTSFASEIIVAESHTGDKIVEKFTPEKAVEKAELIRQVQKLPDITTAATLQADSITDTQLKRDKDLTERLLNQAIETGNVPDISHLLEIYQTFSNNDPILVLFAQAQIAKKQENYTASIRLYREILALRPELTPVRVQLATSLFYAQQDTAARDQFEKALSDEQLPADIAHLIHQYISVLDKRGEWQFSLSANYLNEGNVNNASSSAYIENTAFKKGGAMLPQKAHGVGYYAGLERDFNLFNAYYLHLENTFYGKSFWDNHDYDDIANRSLLGLVHKTERQRLALLPFYEQQWYGGHRYKRTIGGRVEFNCWLTPNWQLSGAVEYGSNFYHDNPNLDGTSKLTSGTILWRLSPRYFLYLGTDYSTERTKLRHLGYNLKTARIGWGHEWSWGISTRLSFSVSKRDYQANLILGSAFKFDRRREDAIYLANLTAWKRDWHFFGITPKVNFRWKKQDSNFDTLYSYSDKSITISLEKTF